MYSIIHNVLEKGYISRYERPFGMKIRAYCHIEESGKTRLFEMIDEYYKFTEVINNFILKEVGNDNN